MIRVLVVGGGAMGGIIAAKLAEAGRDVVVLDANVEHVARIRAPGLCLEELGRSRTVPLAACSDPSELSGSFDVALVAVKASHLEAALRPLVARDVASTYVSLGNGFVQERVEALAGHGRVVWGTVEWGATNLGVGHVARTTENPFVIGEADGPARERTRAVAGLLEAVAEVRISGNIRGQVWSKLLVNSTFSGLSAITGRLYGDVVADPAGRSAAYGLWTEGFTVAHALGAELDEVFGIRPEQLVVREPEDVPCADRALDAAMRRAAATKASMLQDLERGVLTEVDVINGAVVAHGARADLPTPLNACLVQLVHDCEQGVRRPGPDNLADLDHLRGR
ncbi:MAG: ketopantoate reductase family protein [Streptomycetales bacterium]